jgi:hypothetical protein
LDLCKIQEPGFVEISASAQILHSFYNGVESAAVLFLKSIKEEVPNDNRWHKTLFELNYHKGEEKPICKMLGYIGHNFNKNLLTKHQIMEWRHS